MNILDDLPDPTRLGVDGLRLLRNLFAGVATTAARQRDRVMASWARTICDKYSAEINERVRSRRELQRAVVEYRQRHPYGVIRTTSDE